MSSGLKASLNNTSGMLQPYSENERLDLLGVKVEDCCIPPRVRRSATIKGLNPYEVHARGFIPTWLDRQAPCTQALVQRIRH